MLLKPAKVLHTNKRWLSLTKCLFESLKANVEDEFLIVHDSNKSMKFPQIWLRDNCRCSECFHKDSQSRAINWNKFDINVKATNISVNIQDSQIHVKWSDNHQSLYNLKWLKEREFSEENRKTYLDEFYKPKEIHWAKKDFETACKTFDYNEILDTEKGLKTWLEALSANGVAMIKNAENNEGAARKIADRVGFIRKTHYGEEFIVRAKPGARNYAYLSTPLPLHTDLPYYEYKPGVNLLHCLVQSKSRGGSNLLADGFFVADRLKKEYPEDFKILTETLVDWNDIGKEEGGEPFYLIHRSPVIRLDEDKRYKRINRSVPQRDSHFSVPLDKVTPWYKAYDLFVKIILEECVEFKTNPGEILTFNNIRCLHGRTGYDDNEQNVRYIVGAYLDWDTIFAKWRMLKLESNK